MKFRYSITGFLVGIINGLFGSGGGTVAVIAMEKFCKVEKKDAHATSIAVILPLSILSIFLYARHGYFDLWLSVKAAIGGVIGGVIGAVLLKKLPAKVTGRIFGIIMIIAAVRLFFM